jgi:hypothetical protein
MTKIERVQVVPTTKASNISDEIEDMSLNLLEAEYAVVTLEEMGREVNDFRLSLACLLIDIRTGLEKVIEAWEDVKSERKSINSAVMVTYVAMKEIGILNSQMQLIYPSCQSAIQFEAAMHVFFHTEELRKFESIPILSRFFLNREVLLRCFDIHEMKGQTVIWRETVSEESFAGDTRDWTEIMIRQDLFRLLNIRTSLEKNHHTSLEERCRSYPLLSLFLDQFTPLYDTGDFSLSLVFAVTCWTETVSILIDADTSLLGKTMHLIDQPRLALATSLSQPDMTDQQFCARFDPATLRDIVHHRKHSLILRTCFLEEQGLLQFNPYLSGSVALSARLADLELTAIARWHDWSYLRIFCFLYHALKTEGYMGELYSAYSESTKPVDVLFATFSPVVFRGSPPECGSNQKKYLLSMGVPVSAISKGGLGDLIKFLPKNKKPESRSYPSKILAWLRDGDFSVFCGEREDAVFLSERLDLVSKQTELEMFGNRCLSLDLFNCLHRLATALDGIDLGSYSQEIRRRHPGLSQAEVTERAVMSLVLPILDIPRVRRDADRVEYGLLVHVFGELFAPFLTADEKDLLIYPPSPAAGMYSQTFGDLTLGKAFLSQNADQAARLFEELMDEMESTTVEEVAAPDRLFSSDKIRSRIRRCPSVLKMQSSSPAHRFPTLLDYAFHHPVMSCRDLAAWMLAMGGWITPDPAREPPLRSQLQLAALHGNPQAVSLLLLHDKSAEHRSYQCPEDGNTALHYAAALGKGNYNLCLFYLVLERAAHHIRNHEGKLFTELIEDPEQRAQYESLVDQYATHAKQWEDLIHQRAQQSHKQLRCQRLIARLRLQTASMSVQFEAGALQRIQEAKVVRGKRKGSKKRIARYDLSQESIQRQIDERVKEKERNRIALERECKGERDQAASAHEEDDQGEMNAAENSNEGKP